MKELKAIDYAILFELVKNSRLSDRQLSRILGVSQPTVTRRRTMLENRGLLEYTAIPDLPNLGYEILAFSFANWKHNQYSNQKVKEDESLLKKHPNILFVSSGMGLGLDRIVISVHKDYADYSRFIRDLATSWEELSGKPASFIVSLKSNSILRNFTFKYLSDYMKQTLKPRK